MIRSVPEQIITSLCSDFDKIHEDYQDDGEYGAGRKIHKAMHDNKHIGLWRFSIMEEAAIAALRKLSD